MNIAIFIKEWLVPISSAVSILSVATGIVLALIQYRLKVKAETRLKNSAQVESDIKLLQLFTEIMNIAHARGPSVVSDKLLELMLKPEIMAQLSPLEKINLKDAAVITLPVGMAAQDAAIAAICELGKRHRLLRPVALRALESLATFKPAVAQLYLDELSNVSDC